MTTKKTTPEPEPKAQPTLEQLFVQYLQQNAQAIEALKPKPIDAITDEYLADPRNREQKLLKPAFQNLRAVSPHGLSDGVIQRLSELKPGEYMGGYVKVAEVNGQTHLLYPSKTLAERFEQQRYFTSFSDLVDKLHAEMAARDDEDKATQDALEALKAARKK